MGKKSVAKEIAWLRKNGDVSKPVDQDEHDRFIRWVSDMKKYALQNQIPFSINENDLTWEGSGVYHHEAVKKYGYNFSPWQNDTDNKLVKSGWFQAAMRPIDPYGTIGHQTSDWGCLPAPEQRVEGLSAEPFSAWEEQLVEAMHPSDEIQQMEQIEVVEHGSGLIGRARSSTHKQKVRNFRETYDKLYRSTKRPNARDTPNKLKELEDESTSIEAEGSNAMFAEGDLPLHRRKRRTQDAEDVLVLTSIRAKNKDSTLCTAKGKFVSKRSHPVAAQRPEGHFEPQQSASTKRLKSTMKEEMREARQKREDRKFPAKPEKPMHATLGSLWDLSEDQKVLAKKLANVLLEAESAFDRAAAAQALRQMPWPATAHVHVLIQALQDPMPDVRGSTAQALGVLPFLNKSNAASLVETLQDSSALVRAAAVEALGNLHIANVVPYIDSIVPACGRLSDDNEVVRYFVVEMLKKMLGKLDMGPFTDIVKKATFDSDDDVKVSAQQLLSAIKQSVGENDEGGIKGEGS